MPLYRTHDKEYGSLGNRIRDAPSREGLGRLGELARRDNRVESVIKICGELIRQQHFKALFVSRSAFAFSV